MGVRKMFMFDTHLDLVKGGSVIEGLCKIMALFVSYCWLLIRNSMFYPISFISRYFFRFLIGNRVQKDNLNSDVPLHKENRIVPSTSCSVSTELIPELFNFDSKYDNFSEKEEASSLSFKFQLLSSEEIIRSLERSVVSVDEGNALTTDVRKYNFSCEKDFTGFVEEPEIQSVSIKGAYVNSEGGVIRNQEIPKSKFEDGFLLRRDFQQFEPKTALVHVKQFDNSRNGFQQFDQSSIEDQMIDSSSNGFLSKGKFDGGEVQLVEEIQNSKETCLKNSGNLEAESLNFRNGLNQINDSKPYISDNESIVVSDVSSPINYSDMSDEFPSEDEFRKPKWEWEDTDEEEIEPMKDFKPEVVNCREIQNSKETCLKNSGNLETASINFSNGLNQINDSKPYISDTESIVVSDVSSPINYSDLSDEFLCEDDFKKPKWECENKDEQEIQPMKDLSDFRHKPKIKNYRETKMLMDFEEKVQLVEEIQKSEGIHLQNSGHLDTESLNFNSGLNQINDSKLYISDTESVILSDVSSEINYSDMDDEFLREDDFTMSKWEWEDTDEEDIEWMEETLKSEETHLQNSKISNEFCKPKYESEDTDRPETESTHESAKTHQQASSNSDSDDSNELESLWEHQDLIEQLKMELKKVKATGLPTILEESESPKIMDDLKPWRIKEKLVQEDPMGELQKFYNSYSARMRKFDILNYQKMYAIGFLQLKDPLQPTLSRKSSIPAITSLLSQNIWLRKQQKSDTDPSEKFLKELQSDLETVYVGQACLSWEFLNWQYRKAKELPEADQYGRRRQYNQVASEFQQFQVVVRRFLENEPFQDLPRVQNYVKNRCVLRNLLQVPAIRGDCLKNKMEGTRRDDDHAISIKMLEHLMQESMMIFWEFIKADKDEKAVILKGFLGTQPELQDPADSELFMNIQAILQKKGKRLKDLERSGNCLVKRFQKHQCRSDPALFFSKVDMKLVSRVMRMSRLTTDQLVWCQSKLNIITLTDRKLYREPSFLLFPC
ncbi:uncharacterized protein LOC143848720 [Tasmannia lanceolata]|uniref:uncharacterized protein LOC143848720 n=1 Tax=Tasmannia lanceolata TaxID=3420 RepID=UPI0040632975